MNRPAGPSGGTAGRRRRPAWRLHPLSTAIALAGLLLTALLVWATATVNHHNNQRLLQVEVRQAAAVVGAALESVQSQLADALQIAAATKNPSAFKEFSAPKVAPGGSFVSLSLWRETARGPVMIASVGSEPRLVAAGRAKAFIGGLRPSNKLMVTPPLAGGPPRLGFAIMAPDNEDYVVYAEGSLPGHRRFEMPQASAFDEMNFAIYLGPSQDNADLVEASLPTPVRGDRAVATAPFGNTVVTIVGKPTSPLTGSLTNALPWAVCVAGLLVAAWGVATMEFVLRRRELAEALAQDNEQLYLEQRGIAATLQRALLPPVPVFDDLEIAARYLPGASHVDVGGDWYDVVRTAPGRCTFIVGDVSGRGVEAATTMAALRFASRAYLAQGDGAAVVLEKLNALIDGQNLDCFATVLVGELDIPSRNMALATAGHYPPLLLDGAGTHYLPLDIAPPVAVSATSKPATADFRLPHRGTLLAFTDGLVEERGADLAVRLDLLKRSAAANAAEAPGDLLDRVLGDLLPGGAQDDTVVMALRWGGRGVA